MAACFLWGCGAKPNYAPCVKGDKQTAEGDVITVRGLGKILLDAVGGNTKKGRICVEITRFL